MFKKIERPEITAAEYNVDGAIVGLVRADLHAKDAYSSLRFGDILNFVRTNAVKERKVNNKNYRAAFKTFKSRVDPKHPPLSKWKTWTKEQRELWRNSPERKTFPRSYQFIFISSGFSRFPGRRDRYQDFREGDQIPLPTVDTPVSILLTEMGSGSVLPEKFIWVLARMTEDSVFEALAQDDNTLGSPDG